jgi:hypothetical protein
MSIRVIGLAHYIAAIKADQIVSSLNNEFFRCAGAVGGDPQA